MLASFHQLSQMSNLLWSRCHFSCYLVAVVGVFMCFWSRIKRINENLNIDFVNPYRTYFKPYNCSKADFVVEPLRSAEELVQSVLCLVLLWRTFWPLCNTFLPFPLSAFYSFSSVRQHGRRRQEFLPHNSRCISLGRTFYYVCSHWNCASCSHTVVGLSHALQNACPVQRGRCRQKGMWKPKWIPFVGSDPPPILHIVFVTYTVFEFLAAVHTRNPFALRSRSDGKRAALLPRGCVWKLRRRKQRRSRGRRC